MHLRTNRLTALGLPLAAMAAMVSLFVSCGKDHDDDAAADTLNVYEITAVYDKELGDRGYNDIIFEGLCRAKEHHFDERQIRLSLYTQPDLAKVEQELQRWFAAQSDCHRLLVVAHWSTAEIIKRHREWTVNENDAVLILDSRDTYDDFYSRNIRLYGLCYLAGRVVSTLGLQNPLALLANNIDEPIAEALQGFTKGYEQGRDDESIIKTAYLSAEAGSGYDMSEEVFEAAINASNLQNEENNEITEFILPLCGGSSIGIYSFMRSYLSKLNLDARLYTCGIDVDQQQYARNIMFSLTKRYDLVVEDFIVGWVEGRQQARLCDYGLESKYAGFIVADDFADMFRPMEGELGQMREQAIAEEQRHYEP